MKKLYIPLPAVTTELWQLPAPWDKGVTVVPYVAGLLSAWTFRACAVEAGQGGGRPV